MNLSAPEGFFRVEDRVRFELRGPDAIRYLNGQVSIDIPRIAPDEARPACLLTAKGKLCAPIQIWRCGDSLIVEGPAELGEAIQARLERYIIADQVEVIRVPPVGPIFHIVSPRPVPGIAINRLGLPGFDSSTKPTDIPEFSPEEIELLRIVHGVPIWGRELTEDTLPQEARLEKQAVDFDKGCYVGQETVSRLKSVGRVNKRLHGFLGSIELPAGTRLLLRPPEDPAAIAGGLTSHSRHFDMAQTAALGYLNRQFENVLRLVVVDEAGRALGEVERRELPIL